MNKPEFYFVHYKELLPSELLIKFLDVLNDERKKKDGYAQYKKSGIINWAGYNWREETEEETQIFEALSKYGLKNGKDVDFTDVNDISTYKLSKLAKANIKQASKFIADYPQYYKTILVKLFHWSLDMNFFHLCQIENDYTKLPNIYQKVYNDDDISEEARLYYEGENKRFEDGIEYCCNEFCNKVISNTIPLPQTNSRLYELNMHTFFYSTMLEYDKSIKI
jgi:hypothetical protein